MKNKVIGILAFTTLLFSACKKEEKTTVPTPDASRVITNQPQVQQPNSATAVSPDKQTVMVFTEKEHDFGTIQQGDKVMHVFTFKNTGTKDLIISKAQGSCGCTAPEYTKEPIAPGKTGTMKVSFNSAGKTGPQHKTVTVYANVANGAEVLNIKANVTTDKTN